MLGSLAMMLALAAGQLAEQSRGAKPSPCNQALVAATTQAVAELCLGEQQVRLAAAAPKDGTERSKLFESAARHYRTAIDLASTTEIKVLGLEALAEVYEVKAMNDSSQVEAILRELIVLQPTELAPMFRLARVLENRGYLEAAEDTLQMARRQHPDSVEPYRMLAQFYSRRVTALHKPGAVEEAKLTQAPGVPDETGVYRVGGAVAPPQRLDRPVYPPEAQAAGIDGVVVAEVVINPAGDVSDARILRSIPLLDEAALQAVRNWHFTPTIVNGQAVPVRMSVTVNFTQSR